MDNMFFSCPYCEETLLRYVTNKNGNFGHAQCSGCLKTGPIIVTRGLDGPDEEWHKIANWAFHESINWEKRDMNPILNDTDIENLTGETVANMVRRNYKQNQCDNCSHCSATKTWCNKLDIEIDWDQKCFYWQKEEL